MRSPQSVVKGFTRAVAGAAVLLLSTCLEGCMSWAVTPAPSGIHLQPDPGKPWTVRLDRVTQRITHRGTEIVVEKSPFTDGLRGELRTCLAKHLTTDPKAPGLSVEAQLDPKVHPDELAVIVVTATVSGFTLTIIPAYGYHRQPVTVRCSLDGGAGGGSGDRSVAASATVHGLLSVFPLGWGLAVPGLENHGVLNWLDMVHSAVGPETCIGRICGRAVANDLLTHPPAPR